MALRFLGQIVFLTIYIEIGARLSNLLQNEACCDISDTFILIAPGIALITLLARIMQGSTESVGEMLVLEVVGTLSELTNADGLLQGLIPSDYMKKMLGGKTVAKKMREKVKPSNEEGQEGVESEMSKDTVLSTSFEIFCAGALVQIAIAEAAAIFNSTLLWFIMNINPSGEFVLTDASISLSPLETFLKRLFCGVDLFRKVLGLRHRIHVDLQLHFKHDKYFHDSIPLLYFERRR